MRKIVFILFYVISCFVYTQDKSTVNLFFDENKQPISQEEYIEKNKSFLLYSTKRVVNSKLNIYQIREMYKIGKISDSVLKETKEHLKTNYGISDIGQTLIIYLKDSIFGEKEYLKYKDPTIYKFNGRDTIHIRVTKKHYKRKFVKEEDSYKKCKKVYLRKNYTTLYLYEENLGLDLNKVKIPWKKMDSKLEKLLFNNKKYILILRPNGEYFLFYEFHHNTIQKLLKMKSWKKPIKDYEKMLIKNYTDPIGIFDWNKKRKNSRNFRIPYNSTLDKETFRLRNLNLQNSKAALSSCF